MAGKFMSPEEAARLLGVSVDEVNRLVDRKKLFPMRDGATIKFKTDDVERLVRTLGEESASGSGGLELDLPELVLDDEPAEDEPRSDASHDARQHGASVGVELAVHREVLRVHDRDVDTLLSSVAEGPP